MEDPDVPTLDSGQEFSTFKEFDAALKRYQAHHKCVFTIDKSDKMKEEEKMLEYNWVKYRCIQGGDKRPNPKCTGERAVQPSYKIGCDAFLHVTAKYNSDKVKKIIVKTFVQEHNHPCNSTTYDGYPQVRKLSVQAVQDVAKYSKLQAKPIAMKSMIRSKEGSQIILTRDLSNARAKAVSLERAGRTDEEMLLAALQKIKDMDATACADLQYNCETKELEFISIQTTDMREALKLFPEVLLMDITYKINKNRLPVCVIEVMNGHGRGEVVNYSFLANEKKETLTDMLLHFVTRSGELVFKDTQCILVDKDFSEIGALRAVMPNAQIHICNVHVERNVKKAAKGDPNKKEAMEAFRGMLHAPTDEKFQEKLVEFSSVAGKPLKEYFVNNWLHLKEVWSLKDRLLVQTFANFSTNRVESENQKLKMIFGIDTTLYNAVDGLVNILIESRRDEARYRDHVALTKKVHINMCSDPIIQKICNELTIYAAKLVTEQYQLAQKPSPDPERYTVIEDKCTCVFFKSLGLTCRHIMRARKQSGRNMYNKDSIAERWWKDYNVRNRNPPAESTEPSQNILVARMPAGKVATVLKPQQKFKIGQECCTQLVPILVDCGTKVFHQRCQLINDIVDAWSRGNEVSVLQIPKSNAGCTEATTSDDSVDTVPFRVKSVKVVGKPSGISETVFDGSKKKGKPKTGIPKGKSKCCVCDRAAGDHHCSKCGLVVHAIPPCSQPDPDSEEGFGQKRVCHICEDFEDDIVTYTIEPYPCNEQKTEESVVEEEDLFGDSEVDVKPKLTLCSAMNEEVIVLSSDSEEECTKVTKDKSSKLLENYTNPDTLIEDSSEEEQDKDEDAQSTSKGNMDAQSTSKGDEDLQSTSKNDEDAQSTSKGNKDAQSTSKGDEDLRSTSKNDEDAQSTSKKDEDAQSTSKNDEDAQSTSKAPNEVIQPTFESGSSEGVEELEGNGDSEQPTCNGAVFKIQTIKCRGRPKSNSQRNKPTWNFQLVADKKDQCCICDEEGATESCVKCQCCVHAYMPCSLLDLNSKCRRICNYCCDYKSKAAPKKEPKGPPYFCFGCNYLMKRLTAKNPTDPNRKGSAFYGCLRQATPLCKSFGFWAPKETSSALTHDSSYLDMLHDTGGDAVLRAASASLDPPVLGSQHTGSQITTITDPKRKVADLESSQATPPKQSRYSGRTILKKKLFSPN